MESVKACLTPSRHVQDALKTLHILLTSPYGSTSATLKKQAASEGIVQSLVDLLKRSWGYCDDCNLSKTGSEDFMKRKSSSEGSANEAKQTEKHYDTIMTAVFTMSCIYRICEDLPAPHNAKFVDQDFIFTLLSYIIPDPALIMEPCSANHFFQFGPSYEASVKAALSACEREGQVMVYVEEDGVPAMGPQKDTEDSHSLNTMESELKFYEPFYEGLLDKAVQPKPCQILIPTRTGDINLAEHLVSTGVAWPQGEKMIGRPEELKDKKPKRTGCHQLKYVEAQITCNLRGNFLWMVIGEEKISKVQKVARDLLKLQSQLASVKPKKLAVVAARVKCESGHSFVRARVMDEVDGVITVIDLDSGCIHQVSSCDLYNLPAMYNLIKLPALASLVCLKGVCPAPLDARLPELALGALKQIMGKWSISTVDLVCQSSLPHALPSLITCPNPEVAYRVLDLMVSLTSHWTVSVRSIPWYRLIPGILDTLRRGIQRTKENREMLNARTCQKTSSPDTSPGSGNSVSSSYLSQKPAVISGENSRTNALIESCVACLTNIMFRSTRAKSVFYENRGIDIVNLACAVYYNHERIRLLCIKTLVNYVYFKEISNPHKDMPSRSRKSCRSGTSAQGKKSPSVQDRSRVDSDESDEEDSGFKDASAEGFSNLGVQHSTSEDSLNGVNLPKRYYVKGDKVPFTHDETHELQATAKPNMRDFAAVICGFLNAGRPSTIYLGLNPKDRTVVGLELDHNARDQMRMSVDHLMMESLSPSVFPLQFHLEFVPVVEIPDRNAVKKKGASSSSGEDNSDQVSTSEFKLGNDFVAEIHIRPQPNVMYCCNGNECFHRLSGQTVILDCQLIRQLLVFEDEAEHVEHISELQQELQTLTAEIAELEALP